MLWDILHFFLTWDIGLAVATAAMMIDPFTAFVIAIVGMGLGGIVIFAMKRRS